MRITIPGPRSAPTAAHGAADTTTYTNNLQFSSEWDSAIATIWMYHADSKDGGSGYYLSNLNLLKDGGDVPVPAEQIPSYKGVSDSWSIAFMDVNGHLWCTESLFGFNIPNQTGPNDIEVVFTGSTSQMKGNTVVITMQDGKTTKSIPLVWFG